MTTTRRNSMRDVDMEDADSYTSSGSSYSSGDECGSPSSCERCDWTMLPDEIWVHVLSYVNSTDLNSFLLCSKFTNFIGNTPILWKWLCKKWDVPPIEQWPQLEHYIDLHRILAKYGPLIGIWRALGSLRGGLLSVSVEHGAFIGKTITFVGQNGEERANPIFRLKPAADGTVSVTVGVPRRASNPSNNFMFTPVMQFLYNMVHFPADRNTDSDGYDAEDEEDYDDDDVNFDGIGDPFHDHMQDVEIDRNSAVYWDSWKVGRMELTDCDNFLIHPWKMSYSRVPVQSRTESGLGQWNGLWRGLYASHGWEVVNVTCNGNIISAEKVIGDPNIPSGQITWAATVHENQLQVLNTSAAPYNLDCRGKGQIAQHMFQEPRWLAGTLFIKSLDVLHFEWQLNEFVIGFTPVRTFTSNNVACLFPASKCCDSRTTACSSLSK